MFAELYIYIIYRLLRKYITYILILSIKSIINISFLLRSSFFGVILFIFIVY
jgi:hypothetical protein